MIVIDASVTLGWTFKEERTPAIEAILQRVTLSGAVAPALWALEVGNSLQMATRKQRISSVLRDEAIADLMELAIEIDGETSKHALTSTLQLSERFALTAYDASYLELAIRRQLPLATLDRQLADAARASGIEVLS